MAAPLFPYNEVMKSMGLGAWSSELAANGPLKPDIE